MKHLFHKLYSYCIWLPLCQILRLIGYLWIRDKKLVAIGAWYGKFFVGAPKYLMYYMLENTDFKVVWIGTENVVKDLPRHERLTWVKKDSFKAMLVLLRAKFWVCCISVEWDLTHLPIAGNAILLNTWHGFGLKTFGIKSPAYIKSGKKVTAIGRFYKFMTMQPRPWTLMPCESDRRRLSECEPYYFDVKKFLPFGTPNNDYMINNRNNDELKRKLKLKYAKLFGYDDNKKIVVYFPSWRLSDKELFAFYNLSTDRQEVWKEMLKEHSAVLIEKHHYRTYEKHPVLKDSTCSIVVRPEHQYLIDVQELFLIADVLISDYSGAYIDFGLMERPCIHFAYDLDEYVKNDSGFYYNFNDVVAGPIVKEEEELFNVVKEGLEKPFYRPAPGYKDLVAYEKGTACKQICEFFKANA